MKAKLISFFIVLMIVGCSTLNRNYQPLPIIEYVPLPYIEHDTIPRKPLSPAEKQRLIAQFGKTIYDQSVAPEVKKLEDIIAKQQHDMDLEAHDMNIMVQTNKSMRERSIKRADSINMVLAADDKEKKRLSGIITTLLTKNNDAIAAQVKSNQDQIKATKSDQTKWKWFIGILSLFLIFIIIYLNNLTKKVNGVILEVQKLKLELDR